MWFLGKKDALAYGIDFKYHNLDQRHKCIAVCLDLAKAFDLICPKFENLVSKTTSTNEKLYEQ